MTNYISRTLVLKKDLQSKSVFLLGPRQTGKSSYIREQLGEHLLYNLLLPETYNKLSFNPERLIAEIPDNNKIVVIDEIQKIPALLDVIHVLIEEKKIRFLLTGSSTRKLRRTHINLLGGRARMRHLDPLTAHELGLQFELKTFLKTGLLPSHYFSNDIEADLDSYIGLYLQQEIANEGLTRNIPAFSRFLEVAALGHAEQINFTKISNETQVARTTVHEYYQILQDTLIADEVLAWQKSKKRKSVATSKYYFFDWGIARKIQKLKDAPVGSPLFGKAFESFIFQELKAYCHLQNLSLPSYWRTTSQDEVDFILNDAVAIEVKSSSVITPSSLIGLKKLHEEKKLKKYILVYTGTKELRFPELSYIQILPWQDFVSQLWENEFI